MTVDISQLGDAELDRLSRDRETDAGAGALATDRGNLPLETLDVRASITGLTARTILTQGFRNPYEVPLEATYIFPLPDRAAVSAMRMEAADHVVEGELKERGQARAEYDEAIAEGKRASIAEEERPDVFTMRVGNILPGEHVTVRLTLDGPLPYSDGAATYRFPLVVAPRYIPGTPLPGASVGGGTVPDTDAVPDASRITPPVLLPGFPNPVRLGIKVDVDPAGLPLRALRSSLHAVRQDGGTVRVEPGERADRDFILRVEYAQEQAVTTALAVVADEPPADTGTFRLTVLPPADAVVSRPRDVVLLLDRSGSMAGWKMVAARRAAARIVDTLTDADRFAVLLFDHQVTRPPGLPTGLVPATDRNRYRAVEAMARVEARGGTEILAPLTEGTELLRHDDSDRDRVLVLVTDGQVGNEDQIVAAMSDPLRALRVHAVGIDQAVNAGFLGRLATLGGGRCELVESEDRLDEAMARIHRRIGSPVVSGLRLESAGLDLLPDTVAPGRLPDLFPGAPVVVSGRYRGEPAEIRVRGHRPDGEPWEVTVEPRPTADRAAPRVWARAHLRDLEDAYAAGREGATEDAIVATSLRFGVLCRFTAFVAVDSRVVTDGGTPHRVTQPVESPAGWQPPTAPGFAPVSHHYATPMAASIRPAFAPKLSTAPGGPPTGTVRRRAAAERVQPPDPYRAARRQVADELRRLRDAAPAGPAERLTLLADLGTRLAVLVGALPAANAGPLADLVARLRACDSDQPPTGAALDRLWSDTLLVLASFAGDTAPPRGDFWKRT
jgi:Ca-activated chloride channel homolog